MDWQSPINRRQLLVGLVAAGGAGVVGVSLGYRKYRAHLYTAARLNKRGLEEFLAECDRVHKRHDAQTAEMVTALKKKYENPVYGRIRVWDLVEKMHQCIDPSDPTLLGMSQFGHVMQVVAAMEASRIQDPNLFLLALLHDAGKVLLVNGELPENVVCPVDRLSEVPEGAGLDNVVFQFGHSEFIYSRLKDHVPEPVAWVARYHTIRTRDAAPYMNAKDREYTEKYLRPFKGFDGGFKSPYLRPKIDLAKYRELIEQTFPHPILV